MKLPSGMRRFGTLWLIVFSVAAPVWARHDLAGCGTTRENSNEALFLHRQALRTHAPGPRPMVDSATTASAAAASGNRDLGNIAIIEDADGVVERLNQFNLDSNTVTFTPSAAGAAHYRYAVAAEGYDSSAAAQGSPLAALDDDDSRLVVLPFAFPFFGATYQQVFVNSDGNLTFTAGDNASTARSLGRMTSGLPRISPLFDDLDPSQTAGGVRVLADATHVAISWVGVPEWEATGIGPRQTFQVTLYPDGRIAFSYSGVTPASAVVGIAPGNLQGPTTLVDFRGDPSADYTAAVAERFGNTLAIDIVTLAQKFYQTHEDAYDYLVVYNNMNIVSLAGAVAYESTMRSQAVGYGSAPTDTGLQYGSGSRLQSMMNMGQLTQYPLDPNTLVPLRAAQGDTPLTVLAHEAGHLFLAFASVPDPGNAASQIMLGYGGVHWSFLFNSEASLLEGERIADRGANVSPRFLTTDETQGYAPLDQYLMGFRPPGDVPDTLFAVTNPSPNYSPLLHQLKNITFDGTPVKIGIGDIIAVEGRRTPDSTVAQRRFRFAFILLVGQGTQVPATDVTQVDTYRQQFEGFYAAASSGNASADTTLKRSLKLSLFPAAGVLSGGSATATLTLQTAPAADMMVQLAAPKGSAQLPALVKIAAGTTTAAFTFTGLKTGVEEVQASPPAGMNYETAYARVQVADAGLVKLVGVAGDRQIANGAGPLPDPIVVRVTDVNNLPYPGARISAADSGGGSVQPAAAVTDAQGQAAFRWTVGGAGRNQLKLTLDGAPAVGLTLSAGSAVPVAAAVVNGASFAGGMAPGALQTVTGVNLAGGRTLAAPAYPWPVSLGGVSVLLNQTPLPLLYVSDTQINFYVPQDTAPGAAALTVVTPSAAQTAANVNVNVVQPGIFNGAVLHAGTAVSAVTTPVQAGDFVEIYCTGLGKTSSVDGLQVVELTPTVFFGATPVRGTFAGLAPGYVGLYQVNAQVPPGLTPGQVPIEISVNQAHSNEVNIRVQ
ncbi:MAG TPA: hypothetical protein VNY05_37885 [Candidatus Acidoferrales bacterium]|nr:hypothetical protein [Candidatus Acidoferrales bacterium]